MRNIYLLVIQQLRKVFNYSYQSSSVHMLVISYIYFFVAELSEVY